MKQEIRFVKKICYHNIVSNKENANIRKIIDPKSGFTLYLREFSDTAIAQVSTYASFPIPQDPLSNMSVNKESSEDVKLKLSEIQKQNQKIIASNEETITNLSKNNKQLSYLVYGLTLATLFSIFL